VSLLVPSCGGPDRESKVGDGGSADADRGDDGSASGGACEATCVAGAVTLTFTFAVYPQLKSVGGSAVGRATGYSDPACHHDVVIVAQTSAGTYAAFSASCPHQCCTIGYNEAHSEFVCPCHGSTFDQSGRVTGGPAPAGLSSLAVCADECGVYVTTPS
jgi:Rieske Fe-S protein